MQATRVRSRVKLQISDSKTHALSLHVSKPQSLHVKGWGSGMY